jgi:hypothetical protein
LGRQHEGNTALIFIAGGSQYLKPDLVGSGTATSGKGFYLHPVRARSIDSCQQRLWAISPVRVINLQNLLSIWSKEAYDYINPALIDYNVEIVTGVSHNLVRMSLPACD